jgi:hypothetical protein
MKTSTMLAIACITTLLTCPMLCYSQPIILETEYTHKNLIIGTTVGITTNLIGYELGWKLCKSKDEYTRRGWACAGGFLLNGLVTCLMSKYIKDNKKAMEYAEFSIIISAPLNLWRFGHREYKHHKELKKPYSYWIQEEGDEEVQ